MKKSKSCEKKSAAMSVSRCLKPEIFHFPLQNLSQNDNDNYNAMTMILWILGEISRSTETSALQVQVLLQNHF